MTARSRVELSQGDYVMVESGLVHAVGRVACGAGVLLPSRPGRVGLDVNVLGTHLPQFYRPAELVPVEQVDLEAHGFCLGCTGHGLTELFDYATPREVLDGRHGPQCHRCTGSGRNGVSVTVEGSLEARKIRIDVDPDARAAVTCELCRKAYT